MTSLERPAAPGIAEERFAAEVLAEQIAALGARLPVALTAVLLNSLLVALVLHRSLDGLIWIWAGLVWALSGLRLWHWLRPRSGSGGLAPARRRRSFVAGSFANGVTWGALPVLFGPLSAPERAFVAVVLVGMAAGAASSNSAHLPGFLAFLVPSLGPLEIQLLRSESRTEVALGVMGLVFVGAMVPIVRKGTAALVELLASRNRNRALAEELGAAREQLAAINAGLEERVRDQTQRLVHVERQLGQAALLASIGSLSASVAHEINSPLSGVIANLAFLEREAATQGPGAEGQREALAEAREGAARVRDIVRNLGSLTAPAGSIPAGADVRETLEACASAVNAELRNRARLVREYGDVPRVGADRARLAQVLLSLVLHAVRSVPAGQPQRHEIRLRTAWDPSRRQVRVEVSDTGPALSDADRARLFDLLGSPQGGGKGHLGLALCHDIVAGLGGGIRAHGGAGRPNTVEVLLPAAGGGGPGAPA